LTPPGFVVTTNSWQALVEYNNFRPEIDSCLLSLEPEDSRSLRHTSQTLMSLVEGAKIPPDVEHDLLLAAQNLVVRTGVNVQARFAVRSSAVSEDGVNSFAGQYRSILNVAPEDVCKSYLQVLASRYSPRALIYRITAGMSDLETSMAVLIIEMIQARTAGVIYTEDPTGEEKDTIFIHSVAGGGGKLVSGKARPHVSRFKKISGTMESRSGSDCPINPNEAQKFARLAVDLEGFFNSPQDIEWALGDGEPFVLQSRPLRTALAENDAVSHPVEAKLTEYPREVHNGQQLLPLLYHGGVTAAQGKATGAVYFFSTERDQLPVPAGAVLVVENIAASLVLLLSKCSAVIATEGSVASHFSTICREFEIPLIVAAKGIKEKLVSGEQVTIDADTRNVYRGRGESCVTRADIVLLKNKVPYFRRLQTILDFIAPLNILDPESDSFNPESCRTLHDIVRFSPETGVRTMFAIGEYGSRRGQRKRLATPLPFELYLVDVDDNWKKIR